APRPQAAARTQLRRGPAAACCPTRRRADRAARPRPVGGDLRLRVACIGDDRPRTVRHRPAARLSARAWEGIEGATRAAGPQGGRCYQLLPARRPTEVGWRGL